MQDQEDKQEQQELENNFDQVERHDQDNYNNSLYSSDANEELDGEEGNEAEQSDESSWAASKDDQELNEETASSSTDNMLQEDMYDNQDAVDDEQPSDGVLQDGNDQEHADQQISVDSSVDDVVDTDAVPQESQGDEQSPEKDTSGKKILLVEDDEALAAVYRSRLELEGFEIYEVHNGEEALQSAKDIKPDLILLDAMMPKISGFDVLDILRQTPETKDVRVIMLTALSQPKDKEKAEALGVDDYLVKSQVVIGDVVERVKHHLGMTS